jgi:hypothetical protein
MDDEHSIESVRDILPRALDDLVRGVPNVIHPSGDVTRSRAIRKKLEESLADLKWAQEVWSSANDKPNGPDDGQRRTG